MRKSSYIHEQLITLLTLLTVVVLLVTRNVNMSDTTSAMLVSAFVLFFGIFALYIWRESPADEREQSLLVNASKHAYLAGAGVLSLGMAVQIRNHELDVWLPLALSTMIISKSVSLYLARKAQE